MIPRKRSRRIFKMIGLLLAPIVLYGLFRLFEYVQVFQPYPEHNAFPQLIHDSPQDIYFPNSDGQQLNGWFFTATASSPWNDWAVLISHGNGGNISHRLDLYELWMKEGFNVLAYDYRGYGKSEGRPSEQGTYRDAVSAHLWLTQQGFSPDRIIALGESLGGGVATELALRKPVGGLVLQSTFTSIADLGKEIFPWLPVRTLNTIKYTTREKLPSVNLPTLILHSREDTMIPFSHAQRNLEAINGPKLLGEITGNHNDPLSFTSQPYLRHIRAYKELLSARLVGERSAPATEQ